MISLNKILEQTTKELEDSFFPKDKNPFKGSIVHESYEVQTDRVTGRQNVVYNPKLPPPGGENEGFVGVATLLNQRNIKVDGQSPNAKLLLALTSEAFNKLYPGEGIHRLYPDDNLTDSQKMQKFMNEYTIRGQAFTNVPNEAMNGNIPLDMWVNVIKENERLKITGSEPEQQKPKQVKTTLTDLTKQRRQQQAQQRLQQG